MRVILKINHLNLPTTSSLHGPMMSTKKSWDISVGRSQTDKLLILMIRTSQLPLIGEARVLSTQFRTKVPADLAGPSLLLELTRESISSKPESSWNFLRNNSLTVSTLVKTKDATVDCSQMRSSTWSQTSRIFSKITLMSTLTSSDTATPTCQKE